MDDWVRVGVGVKSRPHVTAASIDSKIESESIGASALPRVQDVVRIMVSIGVVSLYFCRLRPIRRTDVRLIMSIICNRPVYLIYICCGMDNVYNIVEYCTTCTRLLIYIEVIYK